MRPPQGDNRIPAGYAIAFSSALILSTTGVLIRHLTEAYHMPPMILAFWRNCFVTLCLLLVLELFYPYLVEIRRRDLGYLLSYGLLLAVFNILWTTSVAINGASIATLLVYSSAGFAALLGWWFLEEELGQVKVTAVALCLAGCAMVSGISAWNSWEYQYIRHHDRHPLGLMLRHLQPDGPFRLAAGPRSLDHPPLHLWFRRIFPPARQSARYSR
jgi:drug/metabolite transporter (DMT)-like permease